jgi:ABC-type sugar transport system ATPase subunit
MAAGIGFVPEDRKAKGLVLPMSVRENITMASWKELSRAGILRRGKVAARATDLMAKLAVKAPSAHASVGNLSGGNQQKVVLAKWLARRPKLLILDEPTRGVDVGAKQEIYEVVERMKDQGIAVLLISSELPELLRLSDRVIVLDRGRVAGELSAAEASEEAITALAVGGHGPTLDRRAQVVGEGA